jgi:hypothetical protein
VEQVEQQEMDKEEVEAVEQGVIEHLFQVEL